jgi:sarcosine oxidase, subunit alpha
LDRGSATSFLFDGKRVDGFEGEPLAAALYARGHRVLSRSMRYHRARGYFCGAGACTHCFVNVNGVPNVRSCEERCAKDAWVEGQNAYPNVEHDVLAMGDLVFRRYFDAHHRFIRPAFLKPLYTRVIRAMAGFGKAPKQPVPQTFHNETVEADVCVVGAGTAGLAAAEAAAKAGARVVLLERDKDAGGRLRYFPTPFHATGAEAPRTEGKAHAELLVTRLRTLKVDLRLGTRLFGIYNGNRLAAASATRLVNVKAKATVLAPGSTDDYRPFPGSDRAGVLLATGALRLLNRHGVEPGHDVAIVGAHRDGLFLARDLLACGARIAAIIDPRLSVAEDALAADLRRMGQPVRWGTNPVQVIGRKRVRALEVERGAKERIPCDAVVLAGPRRAAIELFQQAGCRLTYDAVNGFRPEADAEGRTSVANVFAAGSAAGTKDQWQSHKGGERVGAAAAAFCRGNA